MWELQVNLDNNGVAVGLNSQPLCCTNANAPQLGMSFSRDGRAFFGGCDHGASMWDLTSNQVQQVAAHDQPIQCVHYVEDNVNQPMLITGGWDGKVRFWDLRAQQPAKEENFNCGAVVAMDTQTTPMATFLHPPRYRGVQSPNARSQRQPPL